MSAPKLVDWLHPTASPPWPVKIQDVWIAAESDISVTDKRKIVTGNVS